MGEPLTFTVQSWDQCERLYADYDGVSTVDATDPAAIHPNTVRFDPDDGGVTRGDGITFESTGIRYLTLTDDRSGQRFVTDSVRVAEGHERWVYWGDIHLHLTISDGTRWVFVV